MKLYVGIIMLKRTGISVKIVAQDGRKHIYVWYVGLSPALTAIRAGSILVLNAD